MGPELVRLAARVPRNVDVRNEAADHSIQAQGVCADVDGVRRNSGHRIMGNWTQLLDPRGNPCWRGAH